ncbi:MAG: right-handed parallel beta-helix repeat-containing protein, partial [Bacteroidales bacterium]|nr:right-handed parallel beta-helix repeat-containing protein [Bacteroidales bacterium]
PLDEDGFAMSGTENTWYGVTCDIGNARVTAIRFYNNGLTGTIPPDLNGLSNLLVLGFGFNSLSGSIPAEIGTLFNLQNLDLCGNQLSGSIPSELGSLTNLQVLMFRYNNLSGSIPLELGNLLNLREMDLSWLNLSGNIPTELGNLSNLNSLGLSGNKLTGSIPSSLANLSNLQRLSLFRNALVGRIPTELGSLSELQALWLSGNNLNGSIPTSLTNLINLTSTDIGYNALYTDDDTLRAFLSSKDPDWENTQTIAPENVVTGSPSYTSIEMSWTPITYTSDSGGYRVFYSTTPGGPYTLFSATADKSASQMEVTGLNPNATYYFVVQTRTEPHSANQNTVDSEYSVEVSAKTTGNDADTDDDGLADGAEDANHNRIVDSGETDPCNVDTDGDGIQDGTEAGLTLLDIGTDTDGNIFISDTDPNTTTDPLSSDTDQDGMSDGEEDANHNGMVDEGETDPAGADRYVSNSGSNLTGDGTSGNPWQTIQFAIDQVSDGGTIHVADGTYTGSENKNINFGGKAITVKSQNGPNNCIIDCEGDGQGFYFYGWEGADSVVAGFTITSGQATYGGGIYCAYSSPTIKNCIITGNNGETHGGGIYIAVASPVIENCVISGNTSGNGGGVFCHWSSLATIANCTISDNVVTYWGGGIYCSNDSSPTIRGCSIRANMSGYGGGGIACFSSASITNCIISENSSEFSDGGGICIRGFSTSVNITDCTISKNTANYGGGISCTHDASATLTNSILWNNVATGGSEIALGNPGHSFTPLSFEVQYSDIKGGEAYVYVQPGSNLNWGDGNINADPMFFGDDYSLKIDSPCIDTGDPSSPFDPDGTRADMGALPYSNIQRPEGLVAYYPFNGNSDDESGSGNHGTVYGAMLSEDRFGNQNSSYFFDGIDDYISVP